MSPRPFVVAGAAAALALVLWRQSVTQAQITNPQPAPGANELQAVTLIFGSKDPEPTKWDGAASLSRGSIERVKGYHFSSDCKINGNAWECSTRPWAQFSGGM